ncbi:MAG: hypothetical protein K8R75_06150 [Deltaproteobacteria bacterium]|nr:hypothetical protein [Deltaproteobacteria bacterium]
MSSERRPAEEHLHIKDWPEEDRPKEMLLEKGAGALSDAALLVLSC